MVFQFEHMNLDSGATGKWNKTPIAIPALKENLSKWQNGLADVAWNSLYFCNHDQPRINSRLGNDTPESAKCIATLLHMMQGTPYVYQGEELGMTNCPFGPIENYRDLDCINPYYELTEAGLREPEELLECIAYKSRDNARTGMQWDDSPNGGFTTGTPWLSVNPNCVEINAQSELEDPHSVFYYYKRLIELRKENPVFRFGNFELLDADHEQIFAYTRNTADQQMLVVCNFSGEEVAWDIPSEYWDAELLLTNYEPTPGKLRPYEAMILLK